MISRVAEICFWFGRYLERAESTARTLMFTHDFSLDAERPAEQCWLPVVIVTGQEEQFNERFDRKALADGELVQNFITWDDENLASVVASVRAARSNARWVREVISVEAWGAINELYMWLCSDQARKEYAEQRRNFYERIRKGLQLCQGVLEGTMLHDQALDFIALGIMMERAGQTARTLDVHHHSLVNWQNRHQVVEVAMWLALLRACGGLEPFLKTHRGNVSGTAVVSFLMFDARFPRSIGFALHHAYERLCSIRPPEEHDLPGGQSLAELRVLDDWLEGVSKHPLDITTVHETLTHVVDESANICNILNSELFGAES
jgi:uncharacterized alpha-E superfamily protein